MKCECDFSSNRFFMWQYEMKNTATMTCSHGQFNSSDWSFCPCAIQLDDGLYKRETLKKGRYKKSERKRYTKMEWEGKSDVGSIRCERSLLWSRRQPQKVHLPPAYASYATMQIQRLSILLYFSWDAIKLRKTWMTWSTVY